ncbi:hypothetical protein OG906_07730 [Streptomyces sp. NBC_01426]|uniref:hypothetical protein n=1 Tax=Streptomyces sp. NBC_01426 TaxID=2975866 RepID=UPI002E33253F|nr:hypothetical protein [Streptomyces sp. NBC_01426]
MRPRESRDRDGTPRSLAEFLARAGVRDRYPHYDLGAAEARLLRSPRTPAGRARRGSPLGWSDPARDVPLDAERARRDLKSACLGAVCDPNAEARLASFARGGHTDLAGAVVFGCLLHLSGLREGARFWWQFAAGSGRARTAAAAYCLFLDHSRRGEHHDARVWARELGRRGYRPAGHRELREVRLCAQAAVLRYVDQLDDPDLGPVPLPKPGLTTVLAAFHPAPAPPAPAAPGAGPPRRPPVTGVSRAGGSLGAAGEALAQARRALAVVRVLERRPLGVRTCQLRRESGLAEAELAPLLSMLCEEGYACRPGAGLYGRGPALDRLAAPGLAVLAGLAAQLRRALARDGVEAAVHLGPYPDAEARIPRPADGAGAPPGWRWPDFRADAHAAGIGACPFTGLDHELGADHVARRRPVASTPPAVVTDGRILFHALDPMASGIPVFDLRACSPGAGCPVAPAVGGAAAGCLGLSLPAPHAHRLRRAGDALRRTAVPVLLALLLSGAIPAEVPAVRADVTGAAHTPNPPVPPVSPAGITPETLRHLRKLFRTPVGGGAGADGPHLVSDPAAAAAYLFAAVPEDAERPRLALPHTFAPLTPGSLTAPGGLVVLGTDET